MEKRDCLEDSTKEASDSAHSQAQERSTIKRLYFFSLQTAAERRWLKLALLSPRIPEWGKCVCCHSLEPCLPQLLIAEWGGSCLKVTLTSRLSMNLRKPPAIASVSHSRPHAGCRALSVPCASPTRQTFARPSRVQCPRLGSPPSARNRARGWSSRAPHLAQLLVDELLQLRGFLRRQRHADSGASRPPQTIQPRSPSSRTQSISGGRSTKQRGGAIASDRAGREPGCRGGTTNCFQTVRTDRRWGCPPSCLIGAVHRAAATGISRHHARSPRPRMSVPHLRSGKGSRPRAGGLFQCCAQAKRRPPEGPEGPRPVTCSAAYAPEQTSFSRSGLVLFSCPSQSCLFPAGSRSPT